MFNFLINLKSGKPLVCRLSYIKKKSLFLVWVHIFVGHPNVPQRARNAFGCST